MEGCLGIVDLENEMGKPSVPGLVSVAMPWLDSHAHSVLRGEFIEVQNLVWLFQLLTFCGIKNEVWSPYIFIKAFGIWQADCLSAAVWSSQNI